MIHLTMFWSGHKASTCQEQAFFSIHLILMLLHLLLNVQDGYLQIAYNTAKCKLASRLTVGENHSSCSICSLILQLTGQWSVCVCGHVIVYGIVVLGQNGISLAAHHPGPENQLSKPLRIKRKKTQSYPVREPTVSSYQARKKSKNMHVCTVLCTPLRIQSVRCCGLCPVIITEPHFETTETTTNLEHKLFHRTSPDSEMQLHGRVNKRYQTNEFVTVLLFVHQDVFYVSGLKPFSCDMVQEMLSIVKTLHNISKLSQVTTALSK